MSTTRRGFLRGTFAGSAVAVGLPFLDCFLNDSGTALAGTGQALPSVPTGIAAAPAAKTPEELELEALQAEMAL